MKNGRKCQLALDAKANPPYSIEAEMAVLEAVLHDNEALFKAREIVGNHDFYHEPHQIIFGAMVEMANADTPIDLVMLLDHLQSKGQLEDAGKASYLWKLSDNTFTAGNVCHHAKIVKDKSALRILLTASRETQYLIEGGEGTVGEIVAQVGTLFIQATQPLAPNNSEGFRPVWEDIPEVCRFLDSDVEGLTTGFPEFDRRIMGLRGLVVLGAGPGVGKSTFCLNVALHVARDVEEACVIYLDVENGRNIILLRLLSNLYGLTIEQLRGKRELEGEMWQADLEEKLPSFYLTTDYSLMHPKIIERQIQQVGADKTLVVLDSLQKLPFLEKQRRDSIDRWLRELEQLKQDSRITVLLVSELSRGEGGSNYKNPSLGAFKESGSIEYSADSALQYTEAKVPGQIALHCVKNRLGESGYIANYSYEQFRHWRWTEVPKG